MFKPVELVRLNIYVLDTQVSRVTRVLGRLGLVHLVDVREAGPLPEIIPTIGRDQLEKSYRAIKERDKRLMDLLSLPYEPWGLEVDIAPEEEVGGLEREVGQFEETIPPLYDRCDRLSGTHDAEVQHLEVLRLLTATGIDPAALRKSGRLAVCVGLLPARNFSSLDEALTSVPHLLESLGRFDDNRAVVVAFLPPDEANVKEALDTWAFKETALPEADIAELLARTERQEAQTDAELLESREALGRAAAAALRPLSVVRRKSEVALALIEAQRHFGHVGHTAVISGWVPRERLAEVQRDVSAATGGAAFVDILTPEELREMRPAALNIPILFSNPVLIRPFERITTAYEIPQYYEVEPTAFLALSFLVMFGVMFGDVGQGLLLAGAGYAVFRTSYRYTDLGVLLMECGIASTVFGFLYGSVFGLENLIAPLWFHPMRNMSTAIEVALVFGALLISFGLVLNVINTLRMRQTASAIFGERGLMGTFIYWVCLAIGTRMLLTGRVGMKSWLVALLIGLPVLSILFARPIEEIYRRRKRAERMPWRQVSYLFLESLIGLGDTFLSYFANTVSFIRIAAFALAHVGLFASVFALANSLSRLSGGGVWYWFTLVLGNLFIILLEGMMASIQAIRLEYYELFGKFFKGGGEIFAPLRV